MGTLGAPPVLNRHVATPDVPLDDLLIHAEFVRGLARDLVGDDAEAEDLVQEAWLRTLRKPPRHGESLRGWFATLLRSLLHNRRRSERRRARYESLAALPVALPSPEHILEREQVRQQLVQAVLALAEPFRTVVLLRYYEGLSASEIAQQLAVPAATVRTRLLRGLHQLRGELEQRSQGLRHGWLLPLMSWAAPASRAAAGSVLGGMVMKKVVAAALLLLMLGLSVVLLWPPAIDLGSAPADRVLRSVAAVREQSEAVPPAAVSNDTSERVAAGAKCIDGSIVLRYPAERGVGSVFGSLVDASGKPMVAVAITAVPIHGTLPPRVQLRDDRIALPVASTDANGNFRIDDVPGGPCWVRAALADGGRAEQEVIVAAAQQTGPVSLWRREPDARQVVVGSVVDRDGQPVPGADVDLFLWSASEQFANALEDPRREPIARGVTDEHGRFRFANLELRAGHVFASTPDGRCGRAFREYAEDLRIELQPPAALRATLHGVDAEQLKGAVLSAHAMNRAGLSFGGSRCFDAPVVGDACQFEALPPGRYGFTLHGPRGVCLLEVPVAVGPQDRQDHGAWMQSIVVKPGVRADVQLDVAIAAGLRGRVHHDGVPVRGARVRAVLPPPGSGYASDFVLHGALVWRFDEASENAPGDAMMHATATTDANGCYELPSLRPGKHRVEVVANGYAFDVRLGVPLLAGEVCKIDHALQPGGVLQVAALELGYVGVRPVGAAKAAMICIANRDFVTFAGLSPGTYEVARYHSDAAVLPRVLGTAEVLAGRTTWLDLRAASVGAVVNGRVTAGGVGVADASIGLHQQRAKTDAFGAFRLELPHQLQLGGAFAAALSIRHGAVTSTWLLPGEHSVATLDTVVELGTRALHVFAVDADGREAAVRLQLSGGAQAAAAGVTRVEVAAEVPERGCTLTELPPFELRGEAVYSDGHALKLVVAADATSLRIERQPTANLRVVVQKQEQLRPGMSVFAHRWQGAGSPPTSDQEFYSASVEFHGKTGADGAVVLVLPPGDYLLNSNVFGGGSAAQRVHLKAAASEEVVLQFH